MSEAIHPRYTPDTPPVSPSPDTHRGIDTLKSLARKVLNQGVSGVSPLGSDTPIHPPQKTDTPLIHHRYSEELFQSMKRLESAGICVAIFETGDMRIVVSESDTTQAIDDGA